MAYQLELIQAQQSMRVNYGQCPALLYWTMLHALEFSNLSTPRAYLFVIFACSRKRDEVFVFRAFLVMSKGYTITTPKRGWLMLPKKNLPAIWLVNIQQTTLNAQNRWDYPQAWTLVDTSKPEERSDKVENPSFLAKRFPVGQPIKVLQFLFRPKLHIIILF